MRVIIDRLRQKLQEERDLNLQYKKEHSQKGFGDFKYAMAVEPENSLVQRLRSELADCRREIE